MSRSSSEGWQRLQTLKDYAFSKSFSRHGPEDEQLRPYHNELNGWALDTTLATFTGTSLGWVFQWIEEGKAAGQGAPSSDAAAAQALAKQRAVRLRNGAIKGGLRLGGLAAVYYAGSLLTAVYRNQRDYLGHTVGSTASATLLGLALRGGRGAVLGAGIGAAMGLVSGLAWDRMWQLAPWEHRARCTPLFHTPVDHAAAAAAAGQSTGAATASEQPTAAALEGGQDAAAAVLAKLEASLAQRQQQREGKEG